MQKRPIHFQNIQGNRRDAQKQRRTLLNAQVCVKETCICPNKTYVYAKETHVNAKETYIHVNITAKNQTQDLGWLYYSVGFV